MVLLSVWMHRIPYNVNEKFCAQARRAPYAEMRKSANGWLWYKNTTLLIIFCYRVRRAA